MFVILFIVFLAIDVGGIVLHILGLTNILKLAKVAWLPGLLMIIGMGFPTFYFFMALGGGFLLPLGIIFGLIGGIWVLVIAIKASKRPA